MSNPSSRGKNQTRTKRRKTAKSVPQDNHIYGLHAIQAALSLPVSRVVELWLADARDDVRIETINDAAKQHGITVHRVSQQVLTDMMPEANHQGGIARCKPIPEYSETALLALINQLIDQDIPPFLLILDGVQDPHNLGACLRTAEAAGAHAVIAPKDRAAGLTPTAIKIASGSAERVPFVPVTNLARLLRELKQSGIWLVGTSGHTDTTLYEANLTGPLAVILGAEGKGIRRLTQEHCDQVVAIPMQGEAESLNVSVASGVCLFEASRQRSLLN